MSDLDTVLDPSRSAHASIQGYLYQAYLGVERWLELKEDEVLRCEGDEDLDRLLRDGSGGLSEQVKAYTGDVNIRDEVVQDTLRRFLVSHHRLRTAAEPDLRRFLFTSTATRRRQVTDDRYPVDVLAVWEEAKEDGAVRSQVVGVLRSVLPLEETADRPASRRFAEQLRAALAWLDGDPERWEDLIRSVEWKLGEPQLTEVRGKIDQALNRVRPGAPPNLRDRLLSEVLDASIVPDPRGRCRTREQLVALLDRADAEVAAWMTGRGHGLVRRLQELDDLRGILIGKPQDLPPSPRPGQLLTAAYEVIPFDETGREEILEDLAGWCADGRLRLVRLIHGDGGLGKTRLLIEWCRRLAAQGWLTGFLLPVATPDELPRLLQGTLPRLVVIDYAETRLEAVRALVTRLAYLKDGPKVRLVLLARREGEWWETLKKGAAEDLLDSTPPRDLPRLLPGPEERRQAFRTAAHAFAHHLSRPPHPLAEGPFPLGGGGLGQGEGQDGGGPRQGSLPEPDLTDEAFGRPLYLHMAALAAAQGQPVTRAADALTETLKRERRYWHDEVQDLDDALRLDLEEALPAAVTALTLLGGLETKAKAQELTRRLLPEAGRNTAQLLATLLHRLYSAPPDSGRDLGGLEPDLLGEELVWEELNKQDLFEIALDLADDDGRRQLLTVLARLAQRPERRSIAENWLRAVYRLRLEQLVEPALSIAVVQGDPVGLALAPLIENSDFPDLSERVLKLCEKPELAGSVYLREVSLAASQRACAAARQRLPARRGLQAWWRSLFRRREHILIRAAYARRIGNLGIRLNDLGRREEALQATQEAVEIRRLLARQRPDAFRPDLASSLNNLGIWLSTLGRPEEGLQAIEEAVEILDLLAQQQPDAFRPALARSLNNLGNCFSALGRYQEARQATQEAASLYRRLDRQRPNTFRPDLARSLSNLGLWLGELGRREEALQVTQEATNLYRLLAQQRPDAFRPDLARGLNNLGVTLSDLGLREEALQATQEAVEIRRLLAQQRPDAFRPELAITLRNFSNCLSMAGRPQEALAAAEEGVRMLAPFFFRLPQAFKVWINSLIRAYWLRCEEAGREPDLELLTPIEAALAALQEAPTPEP